MVSEHIEIIALQRWRFVRLTRAVTKNEPAIRGRVLDLRERV
jgi:hypothetical protein